MSHPSSFMGVTRLVWFKMAKWYLLILSFFSFLFFLNTFLSLADIIYVVALRFCTISRWFPGWLERNECCFCESLSKALQEAPSCSLFTSGSVLGKQPEEDRCRANWTVKILAKADAYPTLKADIVVRRLAGQAFSLPWNQTKCFRLCFCSLTEFFLYFGEQMECKTASSSSYIWLLLWEIAGGWG